MRQRGPSSFVQSEFQCSTLALHKCPIPTCAARLYVVLYPRYCRKSLFGVTNDKFVQPLMRFTRGDVRGHIATSKIDHGPPGAALKSEAAYLASHPSATCLAWRPWRSGRDDCRRKGMSMRQQNKRAQLRHGATTPAQEYHRDVEMREAVKAAEEQVNSAWCDSSSTRQQLEAACGPDTPPGSGESRRPGGRPCRPSR